MKGPTPEKILSIGLRYKASRTLLSAADVESLERKVGLHPQSSRDLLEALVALPLLGRENAPYRNSVEADWFLHPAKPSDIGGIPEMGGKRSFGQWNFLTRALQTDKCEVETEGGYGFSVLDGDPKRLRTLALTGSKSMATGIKPPQ